MEAVKTQDIGVNDLPWKIEYHAERCTMCGSCVAGCSFKAIKVEVQKQSLTVSEGSQPEPKHTHIARPIIKQVASLTDFCRGCGMCEKICPNNAIRPVRNADTRKTLLSKDNGPIKRGGRTNLNAQRTLDSIIVGRISQMTDPALDSVRHTFDIRAPFGRVLPAKELPFDGQRRQAGAEGSPYAACRMDLSPDFLGYVHRRPVYQSLGSRGSGCGLSEREVRPARTHELRRGRYARKAP